MTDTSFQDALAMARGIADALNRLAERGHLTEWDVDAGRYRVDGVLVSDVDLLGMAATVGGAGPVQ